MKTLLIVILALAPIAAHGEWYGAAVPSRQVEAMTPFDDGGMDTRAGGWWTREVMFDSHVGKYKLRQPYGKGGERPCSMAHINAWTRAHPADFSNRVKDLEPGQDCRIIYVPGRYHAWKGSAQPRWHASNELRVQVENSNLTASSRDRRRYQRRLEIEPERGW